MTHRTVGSALVEPGIAAAPLCAALLVIISGEVTRPVVRGLVLTMFLSSVIVLVVHMRGRVTDSRLATAAPIAGFIAWYGYPAAIAEVASTYREDNEYVSSQAILWSVLCGSSFFVAAVAASGLLAGRRPEIAESRRICVSQSRLLVTAAGACAIGFAAYVSFGEGLISTADAIMKGRDIPKPWQQNYVLGDNLSPFTYVASSFIVGGAGLLWYAFTDRRIGVWLRLGAGGIALAALMTVYIDYGTRSLVVLILLPVLSSSFIAVWKRSRVKAIGWLCLAGPLLLLALQFQLLYRTELTRSNIPDLVFERWLTLGGTIDFFNETIIAVSLVPAEHRYFHESVALQFLTSPIPRFLWPGKPTSELVWFYTFERWSQDLYRLGGNVLPGVVAQYYMSWGPVGPVMGGAGLGLIAGWLERWMSRIEASPDQYLLGLGAIASVWLFISYRLLSPGFLYPVLAAALVVKVNSHVDGWARG